MNITHQKKFDKGFGDYSVTLSFGGYVVTDENWNQKILQCPWSRIYYVMDGEGIFELDGESIKIEPGYVYFAPCGVSYGFYGLKDITKLFFHVNVIKPDGYDVFSTPDARIMRFKRSKEEMEKFVSWYLSEDPIKHMALKSEIIKTVAEAAGEISNPLNYRAVYSRTVADAIFYIRQNLSADLRTGDVADAVFCSVGNLNERFIKEIGTTVAKYIDDLLMFEARKLLASGNKTVGEISSALGYCDQFYFSRRFTKRFSITPKDYRKSRSEI